MTPEARENRRLLIHFLLALTATVVFMAWCLGSCAELPGAVPDRAWKE